MGLGTHPCFCVPPESRAGSVLDFRVVEAGPTFLRLAWQPGPEPPRGYSLSYAVQGEGMGPRRVSAAWAPCLCAAPGQRDAGMSVNAGIHAWRTVGVYPPTLTRQPARVRWAWGAWCVEATCVFLHPEASCARFRVCAWACTMAGGLACAPVAAAHGGQAADPCSSQGRGWSHTPGSLTLAWGAPGGAPALAHVPASSQCSPPLALTGILRAGCRPTDTPSLLGLVCAMSLCPHTPPGAPQREEKSLTASAQSATLSNLQPDTEYVVMLQPHYAQQPAAPATLTARTRKCCAQPWAQPGLGMGSQHRDAPLQSLWPVGMGLPGPWLPLGLGWGCR